MRNTPDFRTTLSHFASGVAIIAACCDGAPVGLSVQSFASLSLEPQLISFGVSLSSRTWPRIERHGRFCASILAAGQEDLCRRFAISGADKFRDVGWAPSTATGSPVIAGALAWVDCRVAAVHPAGDHCLVVAEVLDLAVSAQGEGPLLFFQGGFATVAGLPAESA
ncbi:flavin reductase family protein [Amycolatopsis sp.]|uniref:flavin reductase family protein n=1 Tax=Amycolatopsis sp. TaxID=37632 RepID=UPI002C4167E6|nr:flavin reductase family protein [Amycolatopsis sp.]HVV08125.1 flavin reductase family protein [Amycolatopsis sp.]